MQRRETNQVTMMQSVVTVFGEHQETVKSYEPIAESSTRLEQSVVTVEACDREYTEITTGITTAKRNAKSAVVELTLHVSRALNALAVKTGNEPLKAETHISRSRLNQSRESVMMQYCIRISGISREYAEELNPYGITSDTIGQLDAAIEQMKAAIAEQVIKAAERKTARKRLTEAVNTALRILKTELDTLIELVKEKDRELYDHYMAVRGIRNLGGGHRKSGNAEEKTGEEVDLAA